MFLYSGPVVTSNPARCRFTPTYVSPAFGEVSFAPVVFKRDEEEDVD